MSQDSNYLRTALTNIHRDPRWWRTILLGGACMLSIVGWPMASGLVVESMENTGKGYATPLPPWIDLGTRYLIGLFALLIDFVLFILPLFLGGAVLLCALVTLLFATGLSTNSSGAFGLTGRIVGGVLLLVEAGTFLLSLPPVARLIFVEEGRIEDAIGAQPFRRSIASPERNTYLRARLISLPAYIPALLFALLIWFTTSLSFTGQLLATIVLIWFMLSALLYAHIAVAQIYALAEKDLQRSQMQFHMQRR